MSASSDYDNTRTLRRKRPVDYKMKKKKYVAFRRCLDCGYDWAQQLYEDETPEVSCPKCGGTSIEN